MELIKNLYTITCESPEDNSFVIQLNKDCIIYKAHFPGMPVTPGVCIIQICVELLERVIGLPLEIKEVVNAKFLNVISPDNSERLNVKFSRIVENGDSEAIKASASITGNDGEGNVTFSKLSIILSKRVSR